MEASDDPESFWWPLRDEASGLTVVQVMFGMSGLSLRDVEKKSKQLGNALTPPDYVPTSTFRSVMESGNRLCRARFELLANIFDCNLADLASKTEQPKPRSQSTETVNAISDELGIVEIVTDRDIPEEEREELQVAIAILLKVPSVREVRLKKGQAK